jgi:hypothetical protein
MCCCCAAAVQAVCQADALFIVYTTMWAQSTIGGVSECRTWVQGITEFWRMQESRFAWFAKSKPGQALLMHHTLSVTTQMQCVPASTC